MADGEARLTALDRAIQMHQYAPDHMKNNRAVLETAGEFLKFLQGTTEAP